MALSHYTLICSEISFIKYSIYQLPGMKTLPHQHTLKCNLSGYRTFVLPGNVAVLRQYIPITRV